VDVHETGGKKVIRTLVPRGEDPPYVVDDYKIYVRAESETGLAVRDEIVELVMRSPRTATQPPAPSMAAAEARAQPAPPESAADQDDKSPRTGVEIVSVEDRNGARYYAVRDLRNGNVVNNVTRKSARRLWAYAISRFSKLPADLTGVEVKWQGDLGVLRDYKQGKRDRYDLVQRTPDGIRYYFGVTDDGIHGAWKAFLGTEDD
jgi:hypothetical protein